MIGVARRATTGVAPDHDEPGGHGRSHRGRSAGATAGSRRRPRVVTALHCAGRRARDPSGRASSCDSKRCALDSRRRDHRGTCSKTRGVISGPVVFAAKAVLTPSAVDFLKSRKIAWSRANNSQSSAAAASTSNVSWLALVSRSTPAVESALDASAKQPGIRLEARAGRLPSRVGPAGGGRVVPRRVRCRDHRHGQARGGRLPGQSQCSKCGRQRS